MKTIKLLSLALLAILVPALSSYATDEEPVRPDGPVNGDNPNIGIKYDKMQGLFVTPYSAKLLGLKMADVDEQKITSSLTLQSRIFDTSPDGKALASAWLPLEEAKRLSVGQVVRFDGERLGEVTRISEEINGQSELVLSITDSSNELKTGKFLSATVDISSNGLVTVVPEKAIIESAEGAFAYVDNGGWTVRTPVELGARAAGKIEIIDGLYFGDRIVTNPVMSLWMAELQLLKTGKSCTCAH